MFGIGSTELLLILVVALVVLGPKSLAGFARTLGKFMGEFRKVSTEFQRTLNLEAARADAQEASKTVQKPGKSETGKDQQTHESVNKKEEASSFGAYPEDSPVAEAIAKAQAEAAGNSPEKNGTGEQPNREMPELRKGGKFSGD